jgi:phosphoglycolate phosphatase-like HAD superfamily hydrolase
VRPEETLVVGDFLYDVQAGQAAGARTMLVDGPNRGRFEADPDYEVASLHEALERICEILRAEAGVSKAEAPEEA